TTVQASLGLTLEKGRTRVLIGASYTEGSLLFGSDRPEIYERGIRTILRNNPASLYNTTNNPFLGATPNIASANGTNLTLRNGTPLNSPITSVPAGFTAGANPAPLVANAGKFNFDLPPTNQNGGGLIAFGSAPRVKSLSASVRREMTPWL